MIVRIFQKAVPDSCTVRAIQRFNDARGRPCNVENERQTSEVGEKPARRPGAAA
jgi:hypothetical protein